MNRVRAETFLRLLAEAELRDVLTRPASALRSAGYSITLPARLAQVAWALAAVDALEAEIALGILADVELALAIRRSPEPPARGHPGRVGPARVSGPAGPARVSGPAGPAGPAGPVPGSPRFLAPLGVNPLTRLSTVVPGMIAASALPAGPFPAGAGPFPAAAGRTQGPGAAGRYVPVGLMILFHDEGISGELDVMSYAHTTSGARLVAGWRARDPLGLRHRGLPPMDQFTVADDRGTHYDLGFSIGGRPRSTCELPLRPDPPDDVRWLDITAPGEAAVRINLDRPRPPEHAEPEVSQADLSPGEQLLNQMAERLLTMAPDLPEDLRLRLATGPPGALADLATGLGATVAALEAADVLSPHSPVPGRLAALCASLRIREHGITAAPALDLPEQWLSLLAHYHRRKPDTALPRDGFAGLAAALPELDGVELVLLGLHNSDGRTWMNTLAFGQLPDQPQRPRGPDVFFPLSIWVRDSGGRWHIACPAGWHGGRGEYALTLRLLPPLTRSTAWIEVLATGQSAEVRATVPLCGGYPP